MSDLRVEKNPERYSGCVFFFLISLVCAGLPVWNGICSFVVIFFMVDRWVIYLLWIKLHLITVCLMNDFRNFILVKWCSSMVHHLVCWDKDFLCTLWEIRRPSMIINDIFQILWSFLLELQLSIILSQCLFPNFVLFGNLLEAWFLTCFDVSKDISKSISIWYLIDLLPSFETDFLCWWHEYEISGDSPRCGEESTCVWYVSRLCVRSWSGDYSLKFWYSELCEN